MLRHDTMEEFNMNSKAKCHQLHLAHEPEKNVKKEDTKTNKRHCPLSSVHLVWWVGGTTGSTSDQQSNQRSEGCGFEAY